MTEEDGFEWHTNARPTETAPVEAHEYPVDRVVEDLVGRSFSTVGTIAVVCLAAVEYVRIGTPATGIPYNYPLVLGVVYLMLSILILKRFHGIFEQTKQELVSVTRRAGVDDVVLGRYGDVTAEEIAAEIDSVMDRCFHPNWVFLGALLGGAFAVGVMKWLGVDHVYPYTAMNFAYGAGHGLFYAPILGTLVLVNRLGTRYIVDIDMIDPDGVGGYREIGDGIVTLVIYGIVLVTLDFLILSSVSFVDLPFFSMAVGGLYVVMLLFLLCVTVLSVLRIRSRLLSIREAKTDRLREEFATIERRYWEKLDQGRSPEPEATHIRTLSTMFDKLHSMELWPINLKSLSRLAFSAGTSAAIAGYRAGYIPVPL